MQALPRTEALPTRSLECAESFDIDTNGDVIPLKTINSRTRNLIIPCPAIFDETHPNMTPTIIPESELSEISLGIFEQPR